MSDLHKDTGTDHVSAQYLHSYFLPATPQAHIQVTPLQCSMWSRSLTVVLVRVDYWTRASIRNTSTVQ